MRALEFITGHVIYNPAYTYKFQLKTTLMGCHVTCQVMPFPKIFTTNIALEPVTLTFFLITTNQKDDSLGVYR